MDAEAYKRICSGLRSGSRLIAVSKTFPADAVLEVYAAGQRCFGENRVQELQAKAPVLPSDIEWHLIGHLQANKVRPALAYASWIHSVDSLSLLRRIDLLAKEMGKNPHLLLEVNVAEEPSKFGLKMAEVLPLLQEFPCPRVCGLMTVAPAEAGPEELHSVFSSLRKLRDEVSVATGLALPELSMGMSRDYSIALEEGATMIRVGSAIFGHRAYPQISAEGGKA